MKSLNQNAAAVLDVVERSHGVVERDLWTRLLDAVLNQTASTTGPPRASSQAPIRSFEELMTDNLVEISLDSLSRFGSVDAIESPLGFFASQIPAVSRPADGRIRLYAPCITSQFSRLAVAPELAAAFPWDEREPREKILQVYEAAAERSAKIQSEDRQQLRRNVDEIKLVIGLAPFASNQAFYEEGARFHVQASGHRSLSSSSPGVLLPDEWYGDLYFPGITEVLPPGCMSERLPAYKKRLYFEFWRHLMRERILGESHTSKRGLLRFPYFEAAFLESARLPRSQRICYYVPATASGTIQGRLAEAEHNGWRNEYLTDQAALVSAAAFHENIDVRVVPGNSSSRSTKVLSRMTLSDGTTHFVALRGPGEAITRGFVIRPGNLGRSGIFTANLGAAAFLLGDISSLVGFGLTNLASLGLAQFSKRLFARLEGLRDEVVLESSPLLAIARQHAGEKKTKADLARAWVELGAPI